MGFPCVDIILQEMLKQCFDAVKADPAFTINDLFEELSHPNRANIATYINRKTFLTDLQDKTPSAVYIIEHHPMLDMPLPQIGISLGSEQPAERYLDDTVGDATIYPPAPAEPTHWNIPKGYWAAASYQIDIVAATKPETVWLAKFVQLFLMERQDELDLKGIKEISPSPQDMTMSSEQQPMTVFNRRINLSCKVANTWTKQIPVSYYETGINTAI